MPESPWSTYLYCPTHYRVIDRPEPEFIYGNVDALGIPTQAAISWAMYSYGRFSACPPGYVEPCDEHPYSVDPSRKGARRIYCEKCYVAPVKITKTEHYRTKDWLTHLAFEWAKGDWELAHDYHQAAWLKLHEAAVRVADQYMDAKELEWERAGALAKLEQDKYTIAKRAFTEEYATAKLRALPVPRKTLDNARHGRASADNITEVAQALGVMVDELTGGRDLWEQAGGPGNTLRRLWTKATEPEEASYDDEPADEGQDEEYTDAWVGEQIEDDTPDSQKADMQRVLDFLVQTGHERKAEAIAMRFVQKRSPEETAARMQVSEATVKRDIASGVQLAKKFFWDGEL